MMRDKKHGMKHRYVLTRVTAHFYWFRCLDCGALRHYNKFDFRRLATGTRRS